MQSTMNEPPVDLTGFLNPLATLNDIFSKADIHPSVRPLYPISRAGLAAGALPVTPKWIRIRAANGVKRADVNDADFRDVPGLRLYRRRGAAAVLTL